MKIDSRINPQNTASTERNNYLSITVGCILHKGRGVDVLTPRREVDIWKNLRTAIQKMRKSNWNQKIKKN